MEGLTVDREMAARTLSQHLDGFRTWPYVELASQIDITRRNHDCLYAAEGKAENDEEYFVEINVFWDDKLGGNVRVVGDLHSLSGRNRGCLLSLLGVFKPDAIDSFIMAPDGSFVGEPGCGSGSSSGQCTGSS